MSYILEALKKSEHRRALGKVPNLWTERAPEADRRQPIGAWGIAALVVALVALSVAVYGVFAVSSGDGRVSGAAPEADGAVEQGIPPVARRSGGAADEPGAEKRVAKPEVKVADARVAVAEPVAAASAPVATDTPVAPRVDLTAPPVPSVPPDPSTDVATTSMPSPPEPSAPEPAPRQVPLLTELPLAFQHAVPDMEVNVHVYGPRQTERFVFINMVKYREGQETGEGAVVEAIIPDGVILRYRGEAFRLPY